jgi:lipid-binding SYLF domain-containing protein
MKSIARSLAAAFLIALLPAAQALAADTPEQQRSKAKAEAPGTIQAFRKADPEITKFFSQSAGYAVFPRVGKVGLIVGGGNGVGAVYEKDTPVGTAMLSFGTIGLQAGAQEFSEIIFFENKAALDRFKQGKFELAANASAVIVKAGASKSANYRDGVVVFTHARGGAMAEAAVGAQKFTYWPDK